MSNHSDMKKAYMYTRFERFWHWAQAALIMFLLFTGFEVHGSYSIFGYEAAVDLHNTAAITWLVLYVFIIFWELTTGEWKQYIPTTKKLLVVAKFYGFGIFKGEDHPVPKSERIKHNPLQRFTYLGIALVLIPIQVVTGLLYFTYNSWPAMGITMDLGTLAVIHMAGAFLLLSFLIVHIYMTTTGHSIFAHMKAMVTGWEDVHEGKEQED